MTEAPERIWMVPETAVQYTREGDAFGRKQDCYVLASVADEDRRKLAMAAMALRQALDQVDHGGPSGDGLVACYYCGDEVEPPNLLQHIDDCWVQIARAAIAEIEGEEG